MEVGSSCVVNSFKHSFRHETFKFHNMSAPHMRCMEALDVQEHPENSNGKVSEKDE